MSTETYHPTARTALVAHVPRARARAAEAAGTHRLVDYIVDVAFIALLAAPFLIFQSPSSAQEAVGATPLVQTAPQPAAADPAYGPQ
jgi:hypothetical protein